MKVKVGKILKNYILVVFFFFFSFMFLFSKYNQLKQYRACEGMAAAMWVSWR